MLHNTPYFVCSVLLVCEIITTNLRNFSTEIICIVFEHILEWICCNIGNVIGTGGRASLFILILITFDSDDYMLKMKSIRKIFRFST